MQAWNNSDYIDLICTQKWSETPDTISFALESIDEKGRFTFKPGQFCTLGFEIEEKGTEYRAYSISSLPDTDDIRFTVKRVDGGLVSNHIVDNLQVGGRVKALKPTGRFNSVDCLPQTKVTMISAGCGISPVMCMVKEWLDKQEAIDIDFVHMARSKENTIYFEELEQLAKEHDNFNLKLLLKNSEGTDHPQGRLDKEWLLKLSPDIKERTVYLCGPVGFMQDMRENLESVDFDMQHFFEESFTPVQEKQSEEMASQSTEEASSAVKVAVPDFGVEVEADADSVLMEALENGGLPIIAACRSGICGSCRVKVKEGDIERTSTETLSEADMEEGYVLACSCKVKSDVEVSLN